MPPRTVVGARGGRVGYGDARHLRAFGEQYGAAPHGAVVLHAGEEVLRITVGVTAAP